MIVSYSYPFLLTVTTCPFSGVLASTKDGGCLKMNESIITSVDGCNATTVASFAGATESATATVSSDAPIGNAGNNYLFHNILIN